MLGRHVANGAASRGVGRGDRCILGERRLGRIEARFLRRQSAGKAEIENLHQSAVGQHHVLRLKVAVKNAELVCGLQSIRNLNSDR